MSNVESTQGSPRSTREQSTHAWLLCATLPHLLTAGLMGTSKSSQQDDHGNGDNDRQALMKFTIEC